MTANNSTFSARLNEGFAHRGINSIPEKVARLVTVTGCSARTAKRWLSSEALLHRTALDNPLFQIVDDLDINLEWLVLGSGPDPLTHDFLKKLANLPPHYIPKLTRYFIRLNNKDPKALRWSAMAKRAELGILQILAMA